VVTHVRIPDERTPEYDALVDRVSVQLARISHRGKSYRRRAVIGILLSVMHAE
jgi:hypothetical protein